MLTLYIGNKNYSSWSLRPWLLLRHAGIAFEERRLRLFSDEFKRTIARLSPAGRVPVLVDDGVAVWDSLAIAEYVAERFADRQLWPTDARERAHARCICAEMHAGFATLRSTLPMNVEAHLPRIGAEPAVRPDIERIDRMWAELRTRFAARGPFLFGAFSVADAFYAPVVLRFRTYEPPGLSVTTADYMATMLALPAMRDWIEAACAEREFLPEDEPYRTSGDTDLFR